MTHRARPVARPSSAFLALVALAAASFSSAGCSSPDEDIASSESANTEARTLTVTKGREWGRCWFDFDGAGDAATLSCTSTARGDDPLSSTMSVRAQGWYRAPDTDFEVYTKDLDVEAGGTVVVGTFRRSSFPIMLILNASLTRESSMLVGDRRRIDFQSEKVVNPASRSASRPVLLQQPFDLWPVTFIDGSDQEGRFGLDAVPYTRSIAPYTSSSHDRATEMELSPVVAGVSDNRKVRYFVAPATGGIEATLHIAGAEIATSIDGPGYYTVTNTGLRVATPEEIAAD